MRLWSVRRVRKIGAILLLLVAVLGWLVANPASYETKPIQKTSIDVEMALTELNKLPVKGRAPKTGYDRKEFYGNWPIVEGCSLRQRIIKREFGVAAVMDGCNVVAGEFIEPYNGELRKFASKSEISKGIQIDHVVALMDSWQKGAQNLSKERRFELATDPLNLIAADAAANMQKGAGDAATWLPKNKGFRCEYVFRQVRVKRRYELWVTQAEKNAIARVLEKCR